ncbi:MAG: twin-arginine translocation signal domain-containing protein, partial [Mesorhizobium sp.]
MTKRIKTQSALKGVTRRDFLMMSAATAATLAAARALLPSGAYAATAAPEVTGAKLGF